MKQPAIICIDILLEANHCTRFWGIAAIWRGGKTLLGMLVVDNLTHHSNSVASRHCSSGSR